MLDWLFGDDSEQEKNRKLFDYGLDKDECKAMEQDVYNFWNFDEEDLEEDDFYYEDDESKTSLDSKTSLEKSSWENFFEDDDEE